MKKIGAPKTGGRTKGTPNKVTIDLKVWIMDLIDENRSQFKKDLLMLDPGKRVMILEKLISYVLPKPIAIETPEVEKTNYIEEAIERLRAFEFRKEEEKERQKLLNQTNYDYEEN